MRDVACKTITWAHVARTGITYQELTSQWYHGYNMYTYMDRKHVRIWSSPRSFWTTIRVTREVMVAGAANTVPKESLTA